ncbi:hypothetical protein [Spirosoma agri]|uniref:Uncharacterized protein n=1 Tax=Spirosoma agri TaxID=1987381 RepID=A0A6M0II57_9BACT|nr:hypothetical protein [Spirosoma agri]NEU67946.1 hypothetical protein [Spirosoma agri]
MATFDATYDRTFGANVLIAPTTQAGCRRKGIYLTWLTLQGGWMSWLFEGSIQRGQSVDTIGIAEQGGLKLQTQKSMAPTMVLHTANLTEAEADLVGTIRESVMIFLLPHSDNDLVQGIRVTIPTGDAQLWDDQTYTNNFTTAITLPSRKSQRI